MPKDPLSSCLNVNLNPRLFVAARCAPSDVGCSKFKSPSACLASTVDAKMFLSRLFRRRNRPTPDPPVPSDTRVVVEVIRPGTQPRNTNAGRRGAVFYFDEDNLVRADSHYRLIDLLSRPRVIATSSERVSTAVRLVDALRRLELEGGPMGRDNGPMSLFIALALRELDALVDAMTYEELWDAFGGETHTCITLHYITSLFIAFVMGVMNSSWYLFHCFRSWGTWAGRI